MISIKSIATRALFALCLLPLTLPETAWCQTPGLQQIEEEDLDESESLAVEVQAPSVESQELQQLFAEALTIFHGEDRPGLPEPIRPYCRHSERRFRNHGPRSRRASTAPA